MRRGGRRAGWWRRRRFGGVEEVGGGRGDLAEARVWLLLWLPLPFYVYSISYGSVPIFIPQLYPHAHYNSRYGMEMLPVLAIFLAFALGELVKRLRKTRELVGRVAVPVALLLVVVNTMLMLRATPLVLEEAMVNSRGRLAIEEPLGRSAGGVCAGCEDPDGEL